MSQKSVLDWLEAHPGWHKIVDIASKIGLSQAAVGQSCRKLSRWGDIEKQIDYELTDKTRHRIALYRAKD